MTSVPLNEIERLACFGLTTPDADRLSEFYRQAFGLRTLATERRSGTGFERLMDVEGAAYSVMIGLGEEVVELLQFDRAGTGYPEGASASSLCFQHFAIVVADMAPAYRRLCSVKGWSAISTDGPQRLPASSGAVTAFKFRDPDGHPLELLAFPEYKLPARWRGRAKRDLFLGIDHSAISVSDSARSIGFYEALGLRLAARSLNSGLEQARLDNLHNPRVEVTALEPRQAAPHLELLCYRSANTYAGQAVLANNDVAATRLVFEAGPGSDAGAAGPQALVDPDGHHVLIVRSGESGNYWNAIANAKAGSPSVCTKPE